MNSISNNLISSITEDNKGIVWIGTGNGLNAYDITTGKFSVFRSDVNNSSSLTSNIISCLYFDKTNNLWVGTSSDGLNQFDISSGTAKRYINISGDNNSISENEITSITSDNQNNLWVGTLNSGANIISPAGKITRFNTANGLSSNSIFSLKQDTKGIMWIGTFGGGLDALNTRTGKIIKLSQGTAKTLNLFLAIRSTIFLKTMPVHYGILQQTD